MKLAISNIAWNPDHDDKISLLMRKNDFTGVEIAPTKMWPEPLKATDQEISAYAYFWKSRGIKIAAMQALLFGRPDLCIFESSEKRRDTLTYLKGIIRLGGKLGVEVLVFGSPKNRIANAKEQPQTMEIAIEFFRDIGKTATEHDSVFCIEPNPVAYGCNFITTSAEGRDLVAQVDHQGFGLHLDAAGMTMSKENITPELQNSVPKLCHFHISESNLQPIGCGSVDHSLFAQNLNACNYNRWCSVEMRELTDAKDPSVLNNVLQAVRGHYF